MKIIKTLLREDNFSGSTLQPNTALFDIETTGLSADTSYLYLIGAIFPENDGLVLMQWFCDEYSEEKEVLSSFADFLSSHKRLVHFNGTGFDIPYLNKKFHRHRLACSIDATATIDIYKQLLPFKKQTTFPDFKQKTLEEAAGFSREDTFSGGDLIDVYAAYAGKSRLAALTGKTEEADALRAVLLLHNHDDLLGLLHLYQKTHLSALFSGHLLPSVLRIPEGILYSFDFPLLPFPVAIEKNGCRLQITEAATDLFLPLFDGTLKFFFSDYKNYSYLKYEDMAVHNSVAEWVDKEAKEKCKPATAYQKKTGTFLALPFPKPEKHPKVSDLTLFYSEYKALPAYTEYTEPLVCSQDFLLAVFEELLHI